MTEQKKEYIMDALSELEDKYVAEAAEYIRQKAGWKYWRELGAAAACVAAVLVTLTTLEYLLIGRMTESAATAENTSQLSGNKQEMAMDSVSAESAMEESFCMEIVVNTATEEAEKQNEYSQGIEWELIEDAQGASDGSGQTDTSKELVGAIRTENQEMKENKTECWEYTEQPGNVSEISQSGITESVQNQSCLAWLSAEEILAQGNDIFMGTVTEKQVYHVTGKMDKYFTVITVEVKDSIRGEMEVGTECRIYLPLAEVNDMVTTNSLVGDLMELEVDSTAIFMPMTATEDTGLGKRDTGEWLCYADFADYYFSEGTRYLFLATEDGVKYEEDVYEIPGEEITLIEVAEYIRKMLNSLE